jgi:uncharacterized membrane-anchored protein YjiN (DUF445 family)
MLNITQFAGHYVITFGLPENAYLVEGYIKDALVGAKLPITCNRLNRIVSDYWVSSAASISQELTSDEYVLRAVTLQKVLERIGKIETKEAMLSMLRYHTHQAQAYKKLLDDVAE